MKDTVSSPDVSARNEVKLAVMAEKINNIEGWAAEIKQSITNLQHSMDDGYAKKNEVETLRARVKSIEGQLGWAIKIVVGTVIISVLGLVLINKP